MGNKFDRVYVLHGRHTTANLSMFSYGSQWELRYSLVTNDKSHSRHVAFQNETGPFEAIEAAYRIARALAARNVIAYDEGLLPLSSYETAHPSLDITQIAAGSQIKVALGGVVKLVIVKECSLSSGALFLKATLNTGIELANAELTGMRLYDTW